MYDNTSHNLGHGIVQDHFGVHGFEKIMFVNLMGPRRWRVHKQPLLSHSAWCNIAYSSHRRRRPGVYPGDCRTLNIWEALAKPAIVCFFWDVFFKGRIHSSGLDIEVGMSMHSMCQWFLFKEMRKLYKYDMTMLCLKRLKWSWTSCRNHLLSIFSVSIFCWIWKGRHCLLWNVRDWQWSPGEGNTFGLILYCRFRAWIAILSCCGRMGLVFVETKWQLKIEKLCFWVWY